MKKVLTLLLVATTTLSIFANDDKSDKERTPQDTLKSYYLDEFVITTSVKETNQIKDMPTAVSVISPKQLVNRDRKSTRLNSSH